MKLKRLTNAELIIKDLNQLDITGGINEGLVSWLKSLPPENLPDRIEKTDSPDPDSETNVRARLAYHLGEGYRHHESGIIQLALAQIYQTKPELKPRTEDPVSKI
jgi:hypothetical protein